MVTVSRTLIKKKPQIAGIFNVENGRLVTVTNTVSIVKKVLQRVKNGVFWNVYSNVHSKQRCHMACTLGVRITFCSKRHCKVTAIPKNGGENSPHLLKNTVTFQVRFLLTVADTVRFSKKSFHQF